MSTATVPETAPVPEAPEPVIAEAQKDAEQALFRWNAWVHVGVGAQDCPNARNGTCENPEHFHAWCRLPNPWQVRDIVDKATAARARYKKMLRDPDSDQALALEEELDELREGDKALLVEELVDKHWPEDYTAAVRMVDDLDDPDFEAPEDESDADPPKRFAGIDQDREEWQRQKDLPEDRRTPDFSVMEANLSAYGEAVNDEMLKLQEPRRAGLQQLSNAELVDKIRPGRIEERSTEVYLHWHAAWTWLACTYKGCKKGTPTERVWKDINTMKQQAPSEVVEALRTTFDTLDQGLTGSRRGKGF